MDLFDLIHGYHDGYRGEVNDQWQAGHAWQKMVDHIYYFDRKYLDWEIFAGECLLLMDI